MGLATFEGVDRKKEVQDTPTDARCKRQTSGHSPRRVLRVEILDLSKELKAWHPPIKYKCSAYDDKCYYRALITLASLDIAICNLSSPVKAVAGPHRRKRGVNMVFFERKLFYRPRRPRKHGPSVHSLPESAVLSGSPNQTTYTPQQQNKRECFRIRCQQTLYPVL